MRNEGLPAELGHRIAELRARHPRVHSCEALIEDWQEDGETRHAVRLDIRWPQHQHLVSGPARAGAAQALQAAFEKATEQLAC
ncbi:MAG TPA: hypothetical protein VF004_01225 [Burkholderiales bacterium]